MSQDSTDPNTTADDPNGDPNGDPPSWLTTLLALGAVFLGLWLVPDDLIARIDVRIAIAIWVIDMFVQHRRRTRGRSKGR